MNRITGAFLSAAQTAAQTARHSRLLEVLRASALSLIVSALVDLSLFAVGQMQEALRIALERPGRAGALLAASVLASLTAWYWARVLTYRRLPPDQWSVEEAAPRPRARRRVALWLPRVAGILPVGGVAAAVWKADGTGTWVFWVAAVLTIGLVGFYSVRRRFLDRARRRAEVVRTALVLLSIAAAVSVVLFVVATFWPVSLSTFAWMNATTLFELAGASWIAAWSWLLYLDRVRRWRVIPIVLGIAALSCLLNWNDDHEVRYAPAPRPRGETIDAAFQQWLAHRADLPADTSVPYPVFLAAAEGGGIRAAYIGALVLGTIQDQCPAFAQHLFAVSGVSGGSIGAAVFAGLAQRHAANAARLACDLPVATSREVFRREADRVLAADFLSPLVGKFLYSDLTQRFLFFPLGFLDRARALEDGLSARWRFIFPTGWSFDDPFDDLWRNGFTQGAVPALFLNTTEVGTGARVVISNLLPDSASGRPPTLAQLDPTVNLRMKTAAVLSARFAYVTPEGAITLHHGDTSDRERFVDGGYFENSGVATAADIAHVLQHWERTAGHRRIRVVVLRIGYFEGSDSARARASRVPLSEVMSPIVALLNTRATRGDDVVRQLWTSVLLGRAERSDIDMIDLTLTKGRIPLILGWQLSDSARAELRVRTTPLACSPPWFDPSHPSEPAGAGDTLALRRGYCEVFEKLAR